jgi:hypothetical protein
MRYKLLFAIPIVAGAQQVPTIRLDSPAATLPVEWTDVAGVVEVQGGKLIVLDARERQVKLADFTARTATPVGRQGSGPGEYQLPMALFAIPGDSAILYDEANSGRPLVVLGDGRISSYSITNRTTPFINSGSMADWTGRLYRTGSGYSDLGASGASGPGIERLDRRDGRLDTIAYISRKDTLCSFAAAPAKNAPKPEPFARAAPRQPVHAYLQLEQWAVGPDGRVAIVCPRPYRVVIIDSTGKRTEGPPIPFDPVRVTEKDKAEWREARQQPVASMSVSREGKTVASFQRQPPPPEPDNWPAYLPPLAQGRGLNGAAMFAPDGLLWIRRASGAGNPSMYDIVGKNGALAYRVQLPPRTKVVGFGKRGIYAVTSDTDDVQRLSRFTFPAMNNR